MSADRPHSLWSRAAQRFVRDRAGMVSAVVVLGYFLVALTVWLGLGGQDWGVLGSDSFAPVSAEHWFGTTRNGQDIFARTVYSTRTAFEIGLVVAVSSLAVKSVRFQLSPCHPRQLAGWSVMVRRSHASNMPICSPPLARCGGMVTRCRPLICRTCAVSSCVALMMGVALMSIAHLALARLIKTEITRTRSTLGLTQAGVRILQG